MTGGGQPLNPNAFGISTSGFDEEDPVVAAIPLANGEGDYLVAWEIDTGGDLGVNAQTVHVDNTGNMSLATLKMFDEAGDETNPDGGCHMRAISIMAHVEGDGLRTPL